jgi:hypothetical protein
MRGWRALPALLLWSAGCEAIVNGKLGEVRCEADGKVGPPACPASFECKAGLCVPIVLGVPCSHDSACAGGGFCLDPGAFGAAGDKACSRPCCTSSDCDPEERFVCWAPPGLAGGVCVAAGAIERGATGARKPWESCAKDADCRSGRCVGHRCIDTCCSDTSCVAGGGACRFGQPEPGDAPSFYCAPPMKEKLPRYAICAKDDDCASGLCVDLGVGLRCAAPCCGSGSCETFDKSIPVRCLSIVREGAVVRACGAIVQGSADHAVGVPCKEDGDCRSGTCMIDPSAGEGWCSDTCCSDDGCGDPSSFACRPAEIANAWALRCEPK